MNDNTIALTLTPLQSVQIATMTETHPYSLEVTSIPKAEGHWQWSIRKNDKLYQRSDRKHASEARAMEDGMATIQKLLTGGDRAF